MFKIMWNWKDKNTIAANIAPKVSERPICQCQTDGLIDFLEYCINCKGTFLYSNKAQSLLISWTHQLQCTGRRILFVFGGYTVRTPDLSLVCSCFISHFISIPTSPSWMVRESNPGEGEIFSTRPDRPWGLPSLLYNGYRVIPGGKVAGAWRWPSTPSSAKVKERVQLYLYSPSGPSWPVPGWTLPFTNISLTFVSKSKFHIISKIIKIKTTDFWDFYHSLVKKCDISEEPVAFIFLLQVQSEAGGSRYARNAAAYLSQQRTLHSRNDCRQNLKAHIQVQFLGTD
jgi:hypothetical protein